MKYRSIYKFCPHCSTPLQDFVERQFSGDVARRKCQACGWIQYRNPTVGVAVVLLQNDQLLIGRRRDGGQCIPCGHVEWDESIEVAARREFEEETGLRVSLSDVIAVKSNFHRPQRQTVGVWYRGQHESGELRPGGDLIEVGFVDLYKLPTLVFPTDREVVRMLRCNKVQSTRTVIEQ